MKKSLIALAALSAFATAAQAQSTVTVYGNIDAGFLSDETKTRANSAADTLSKAKGNAGVAGETANGALSPSRIGLRGSEDLGGGLSATFNVEYQLVSASGVLDTTTSRTSIVGLSDKKMGTIEIGRQTTGVHAALVGFNPIGGSNMVGDIGYSAATRLHGSAASATDVRANGFVYKSPVMNGFQARVDYTTNSSAQTQAADSGSKIDNMGIGLNYSAGAFKFAAATQTSENKNALRSATNGINAAGASTDATGATHIVQPIAAIDATNDQSEAKVDIFAAQYVLGKATLFAMHGTRTAKTEASSVLAQSAKIKATQVGISYPVSAKVTVNAIYGEGTMKATDVAATRNDRDTKAYLANVVYSMSKRTNVYAAYGYQEAVTKTGNSGATIDAGDYVKRDQLAVGLRHSF
jgi:predicted porin